VVGVRALKQNASAVVSEAAAGEIVTITDRGRPVAQIVPLRPTLLDALVAANRARPPKRSLRDLGEPPPPRRHQEPLSKVVDDMRQHDRF
jgi:prevent-host-death family protein